MPGLNPCVRRPGTIRWPRGFERINWPKRPSDGWSDKALKGITWLAFMGKGLRWEIREHPVCNNCHSAHQISDVRTASWQMKTTATCGQCHKEEVETYRDTFHAQVSALGYQATARCWDCHGEHAILPPTDPKSPVAKANLKATCGKCHSGVTESFVSYQPHADRHNRAGISRAVGIVNLYEWIVGQRSGLLRCCTRCCG